MEKPRVLIVDDSRLVRSRYSKLISEQGMAVETAENGEVGFKKVFEFEPDVIIMDIEMPVMDGFAAIRVLKAHDQTRHIPIIVFTTRSDVDRKVKALDLGADDFLAKDSDEAELVARLRSLLRVKALEDDLLKESNKFYSVVNDLAEAVLLVDKNNVIVHCNIAAYEVLDVPPELVGTITLEKLLADCKQREDLLAELEKEEVREFEIDLVTSSGPKNFRVNARPVYLTLQEKLGRAILFRDTTREKEMERMRSEFYSMIAHDLRSPISVITGYTGLMLKGRTGELNRTQKEFLEAIEDRAQAMLKLVDEFLTVSKYGSGFIKLEPREVNVVGLVEEVMHSLALIAESKKISTELKSDKPVPVIMADRDKLLKVFSNLYDNALKYTPEGGRIEVTVSRVPAGVEVVFKDTGIGIDEKEIGHIFDAYQRVGSARERKIKGTGLGLAIVKEIVTAHRGKVWAESKPGEGSCFYVVLPTGKKGRPKKTRTKAKAASPS